MGKKSLLQVSILNICIQAENFKILYVIDTVFLPYLTNHTFYDRQKAYVWISFS